MTWFNGLEAICRPDVPLREHTWYKLGGAARWFLTPRNENDLHDVLAACRKSGVSWRLLGHGANLLVRDEGVDGAVIALNGPVFEDVYVDGETVLAGAGADFPKLVKRACARGLAGLEALAGIPGSMGGIIRMNAGGRHGDIARFVESVRLLDVNGEVVERPAAAIGFGYRHTNLDGCILLGARLRLGTGDPDALLSRFREIWNEKYATQPAVSERSAGCIFRNPPGQSAGALIDRAGLKGERRGAAEISRKHANFIVAHPGATSRDVLELIDLARERVRSDSGVELQTEVEIW